MNEHERTEMIAGLSSENMALLAATPYNAAQMASADLTVAYNRVCDQVKALQAAKAQTADLRPRTLAGMKLKVQTLRDARQLEFVLKTRHDMLFKELLRRLKI